MDADPAAITERLKGTLSDLLGVRFVEATPARVVAELTYRPEPDDLGRQPSRRHSHGVDRHGGGGGHRAEPAAGRQDSDARVEDQLLRRRLLSMTIQTQMVLT
jgi:hypothetical protein